MAEKVTSTDDLSSKDFQRKLFDWFDKRGLLSELRAFMRHRMISALYSSESPYPTQHVSSMTRVSPTLQAMLLLVAEFIVQQEYHYTMSVMVAEAPLLASFPKFSDYVSYLSHSDSAPMRKAHDLPRYAEKDVMEMLEVLGFDSESESAQHILRLYSNNFARESLLACVLTALSVIVGHCSHHSCKQNKTADLKSKVTHDREGSTHWIEEMRLVLLQAQLTSAQLQQVEELLCRLHSHTTNKVRKEELEKAKKLGSIREQQLLAEILMREENFRAQSKEAEEDLRKKQIHLEQVTVQLREQHDEVLSRLNRVQRHADEVRRQECELSQREKALEEKQSIIEEEHRTLAGLREELHEAASSLRHNHSETKTLVELKHLLERCNHLEKELTEAKNQLLQHAVLQAEIGVQTSVCQRSCDQLNETSHEDQASSCTSECSSNIHSKFEAHTGIKEEKEKKGQSNQSTLLKRVLRRVQQENSELRANAIQQRKRIDELTTRAAQLATHIADHTEVPGFVQADPHLPAHQIPPHAPPLPPRLSRNGGQLNGDVDLLQAAPIHSSTTTAHTIGLQERERRRKPSRRVVLQSNMSSDESPTEEVLREARNRLKKLEEESEAVDQSYRDFRARQVKNLSSAPSMLLLPTHHSSVDEPVKMKSQESESMKRAQSFSSPTLPLSAPLSSLQGLQFTTPTKASSLYPRPLTCMHLPPNLSKVSQSKFTLPERPLISQLPTSSSYRFSESVPYRSLLLGGPADRLRTLLGSRAGFKREFPQKEVESLCQSDVEKVGLSGSKNVETCDTSSKKGTQHSNQLKADDELQKMDMASSPQKAKMYSVESTTVEAKSTMVDFISSAACQYDPKNLLLHYDPSNEEEDKQIPEQIKVVLCGGEDIESQFSKNDHADTVQKCSSSAEPHLALGICPVQEDVEGNQETLVQPTKPAENSGHSRSADPAQNLIPLQPSLNPLDILEISDHCNFKKPKHKASIIDTTSNEISSLSSAAASQVNSMNLINRVIVDPEIIPPAEPKNKSLSLSPLTVGTHQKSEDKGVIHPTQVVVQNPVNDSSGSANQLLNTSLSSIENSDFKVSAGSGNIVTDDDDFW